MGTIEIEEGPFLVTQVPWFGDPDERPKVEQVRVRILTGPMQGEPRQWAASWVESTFPKRVRVDRLPDTYAGKSWGDLFREHEGHDYVWSEDPGKFICRTCEINLAMSKEGVSL